jgi:hypothetical protein
MYKVNVRLAYAMRCIGKGREAAKTFCGVVDLTSPPRFECYNRVPLDSLADVSNMSTRKAVKEAVDMNDDSKYLAAAFDGFWQKRGQTSLSGVVSATSIETGKVTDVECLTKYCHGCHNHTGKHHCVLNFEGFSGGMESAGVLKLFQRSVQNYGVWYTKYLGDGDSKGFLKVTEAKPCGNSVTIGKLECVDHVQKRLGTRLRKLRKDTKKKKLCDGKPITGRSRLTDAEDDLLQQAEATSETERGYQGQPGGASRQDGETHPGSASQGDLASHRQIATRQADIQTGRQTGIPPGSQKDRQGASLPARQPSNRAARKAVNQLISQPVRHPVSQAYSQTERRAVSHVAR